MDFVNFMNIMIIILLLVEVNRMLTSTLETIRQAAAQAHACEAQFRPFCQAIDNGNELLAWQIVLGNRDWLNQNLIFLPSNLEELAHGIGIRYYNNGQLAEKINWKDGKIHGLREWYYENGQLMEKSNWKNDKWHGLSELFYQSGGLYEKANWEDGKLHGLFELFYEDGRLIEKSNWKDGKQVC